MKWEWTDASRTVVLDYNYLFSTKQLTVDGRTTPIKRGLSARHWEHEFMVGEQPALLSFALRYFLVPEADLEIDGRLVQPRVAPPKPAPWIWAFVVANAAILLFTAGFSSGMVAGLGGVACLWASMTQKSERTRILLCMLVTAATWSLLLAAR